MPAPDRCRHHRRQAHPRRRLHGRARRRFRRTSSAAIAIVAALEQAGVAPRGGERGDPRPGADRGAGPESGAPGVDGGGRAQGSAGLGRQPGLRLGPARGGAGQPGDPDRRCARSSSPAARNHEPLRPCPEPSRRHQDGRARADRHDDQGRPDRRVQQLSHGHHRRESRRALPDHPRRRRTTSRPPRRTRLRRRAPRAGSPTRSRRSRSRAARATRSSTRTNISATESSRRRLPACAPPSARTAR